MGLLDDFFGAVFGESKPEESRRSDELPLEVAWFDDEDGRALKLEPKFPRGDVDALLIYMLNSQANNYLKGLPPYQDRQGDFIYHILWTEEEEYLYPYIPFGSFTSPNGAPALMRIVYLTRDGEAVGHSYINIPWETKRTYNFACVLRPVINLAMHIARADGSLQRAEVACIKQIFIETFELDQDEQDMLRQIMKAELTGSVSELISQISYRLPELSIFRLLELLADVAHADDQLHEKEVSLIKEAALALGFKEEEWHELADELELTTTSDMDSAYAELGLHRGASQEQIKAAYRQKMRDYHPDKVANLPIEFKEVAEKKSKSINAAYNRLIESQIDCTPQEIDAAYAEFSLSAHVNRFEIRLAYRNRVRQYDPDRFTDFPHEFIELATRRRHEIEAAYKLIIRQRDKQKSSAHV